MYATASAMSIESPAAYARAAASFPPTPASRCVPAVPRKGGPPTAPAGPKPGSWESLTPAAIRSSAAAPTAPATGAAAGRVRRRDYVHPAASAGRRRAAPSASHAARPGAYATAGAMTRAAPPAGASAAAGPHSPACRGAGAAPSWKGSALRPSAKRPRAGSDTQDDARDGNVWIARLPWPAVRAARAARDDPTRAPPNPTAPPRRSPSTPWSSWERAT